MSFWILKPLQKPTKSDNAPVIACLKLSMKFQKSKGRREADMASDSFNQTMAEKQQQVFRSILARLKSWKSENALQSFSAATGKLRKK